MPDAVEAWFQREILCHEAALVRFLSRRLKQPADVQGVRHDIYVRVLESAERERPRQPRAFLFTVAGHILIDRARRDAQRYATAVGGSRVVTMPDGSRITLDTDSSVVAVGTKFSVRRTGDDVRVIVTEGTVRLGDRLVSAGGITRAEGAAVQTSQAAPGEVERNLSWRTGILTFRHPPLAEAAAEFNRYDTRQIVIRDPAIGALELGGAFRSSDVDEFARALERILLVQATFFPDRIELSSRRSP